MSTREILLHVRVIAGLIVLISLMWGCERSKEDTEYSVDDTIQEDEWPIYRGPCVIFQAPEEFQVTEIIGDKLFAVTVYEKAHDDSNRKAIIGFGMDYQGFQKPHPMASEFQVGGMDGYYYEKKDRKTDKFDFRFTIDAPHLYNSISGGFRDLTDRQRNSALNILRTLRVDTAPRDPETTPSEPEYGTEYNVMPLEEQEYELPTIQRNVSDEGCR